MDTTRSNNVAAKWNPKMPPTINARHEVKYVYNVKGGGRAELLDHQAKGDVMKGGVVC